MGKIKFKKVGQTALGIATEILMAVSIMAVALGLSWLISQK